MTSLTIALVVTLVATGVVIPGLVHARIMDVPNERSSHRDPTPRGGGLGVLVGLCVGVAAGPLDGPIVGVLVVTMLAGALGFADDLSDLSASVRLGIQMFLATVLGFWLLVHYSDDSMLTMSGAILAAVWIVGYLNAFNFMDGINGISALSAAIAGAWYAWLGYALGASGLSTAGCVLAGAALGFLPWNAPRARVFLGDVGSYGLGTFIAALGLMALLEGANPVMAAAPLVIYVADTGWALLRRVRRGDSWREAHREHVYQRLVDGGWTHLSAAVAVALSATVVTLTTAVLAALWAVAAALLIAIGYLAIPVALQLRRHSVAS